MENKVLISEVELKSFFSVSTLDCPFCHYHGYLQTTLHSFRKSVKCNGCNREMIVEIEIKPEVKIYY